MVSGTRLFGVAIRIISRVMLITWLLEPREQRPRAWKFRSSPSDFSQEGYSPCFLWSHLLLAQPPLLQNPASRLVRLFDEKNLSAIVIKECSLDLSRRVEVYLLVYEFHVDLVQKLTIGNGFMAGRNCCFFWIHYFSVWARCPRVF